MKRTMFNVLLIGISTLLVVCGVGWAIAAPIPSAASSGPVFSPYGPEGIMFQEPAVAPLTVGVRGGTGVEVDTRDERTVKKPAYLPGEILVRWKDGVDHLSIEQALALSGAKVISTFYATHRRERTIQRVGIREGQNVEEAVREFGRNPRW